MDSKYRMPLYRSFYPGLNLTPRSRDVLSQTEGEEKHVLAGFPKEYQTSDVVRLFAATNAEKDLPVFATWINDDSVVVRFANDDAKVVLANLAARIAADATELNTTKIVTLDAYMSAVEQEQLADEAKALEESARGVKRCKV